MRYLIVDDSETFRSYLKEIILRGNDESIELDNGTKVCTAYKEFNPDWVLLDIEMKKLSGFEIARKLKMEFPAARVIFVSDYNDERFRTEAGKVGAEGFIPKENLFELMKIIYPNENHII